MPSEYGVQESSPAVEQRQGPNRPAPSHNQIKVVEMTLRELWFWAQKTDGGSGMRLGAPMSRMEGTAREALLKEASRAIFDAFGMEQLPLQPQR